MSRSQLGTLGPRTQFLGQQRSSSSVCNWFTQSGGQDEPGAPVPASPGPQPPLACPPPAHASPPGMQLTTSATVKDTPAITKDTCHVLGASWELDTLSLRLSTNTGRWVLLFPFHR